MAELVFEFEMCGVDGWGRGTIKWAEGLISSNESSGCQKYLVKAGGFPKSGWRAISLCSGNDTAIRSPVGQMCRAVVEKECASLVGLVDQKGRPDA